MSNEVVQTIWRQISIHTKMACGVRDMISRGNELKFKVHSKPMRYVRVEYMPGPDLYDVEYFRLKRGSLDKVSMESAEGVYADMLSELIYDMVNKGAN